MIEKILLVQPPLRTRTDFSSEPKGVHPPLGLAYLGAVLEKDFEVKILDMVVEGYAHEERLGPNLIRYGLSYSGLEEVIASFRPDVVGVSNLFSSGWSEALQVARTAKAVERDIVTVLGGPHPSACPELVLENPEIDFVVLGEGEESFRDLLAAIPGKDFETLDGIGLRIGGGPRVMPKTRFIRDLDTVPFPARHLLPMEKYFSIGEAFILTRDKPFTPVVTSRGCTAQCTFCPVHAAWGKTWRARSAVHVLDEIELLVKTYGLREIHFDDDNLVLNRRRAEDIFRGLIERGLNISWTVPTGLALWAIDEPLVDLMAESGCYKLYIAVESGDEALLRDVIRKPLDLETVRPLVRAMKRRGIEVETFFVVGMPGESPETLARTFAFARSLDAAATHYFFANPMPGTALWEESSAKGYFREGFTFDDVRVERANLDLPGMPARFLERRVAREQLAGRLQAFLRHPLRTLAKGLSYLKKDRRVVARFLLRNLGLSLNRKNARS